MTAGRFAPTLKPPPDWNQLPAESFQGICKKLGIALEVKIWTLELAGPQPSCGEQSLLLGEVFLIASFGPFLATAGGNISFLNTSFCIDLKKI